MFFLCSKIYIDTELSDCDPLQFKKTAQRIEKKFLVTARVGYSQGNDAEPFLAVVALGSDVVPLKKKLQQICDFIENDGAGRIYQDKTIVESIDVLDENEEE